jgi:hypothetical protein
MVRGKMRRRSQRVEEDPMAGTANITDLMLVLAVGFLIFVVISMNMQDVVFSDTSSEQTQTQSQSNQGVTEVTQGQNLNETPDTSEGADEGYVEMGKVYKDPETGKLIMVEG